MGFASDATLFYWKKSPSISNFGDALSPLIVEKIIGRPPSTIGYQKRLLAVGSILHFARNGDVIWGTGINGKIPERMHDFKTLDVRAVRGPITRRFLLDRQIPCPEIYGDPALLLPLLFPELKPNPKKDFIVIPNLNEIDRYKPLPNLVLPTEDCREVLGQILEAKLVISGSLHGIIAAESFGIPAILLRLTEIEPLLKYRDYYAGTGREEFPIAFSLEEALEKGGAPPHRCDLQRLLQSFPYEIFSP